MLKKQQLYQQQGKRLVSRYPADKPRLDAILRAKLALFGYHVPPGAPRRRRAIASQPNAAAVVPSGSLQEFLVERDCRQNKSDGRDNVAHALLGNAL